MTDGKATWVLRRLSPGDLGLPFDTVTFTVRDERTGQPLRLAAWWIPNPRAEGRCVVLVHGYADAKVGAIAWAPLWHSLGFNVLAFDLRAHGESEGTFSTAGYYERHDLNAVINLIRAERAHDTREVILFGVSMGAAVVTAAAATRDDLAAVVLESPFADFRRTAMIHIDLLGMPGPLFQRAALRVAEWLSGADFDAVRPVDLIPRLRCPVMVVVPELDVLVAPNEVAALRSAVGARESLGGSAPDIFWLVPGAEHALPLEAVPAEYREQLSEFLSGAFTRPPVALARS
jgi:pimeloyl-ACP methyl ester carboxylesterase